MSGLMTSGLIVAALAAVTFAEPASQPAEGTVAGKKLIEFGWDEPDTAFMRKHTAQMDATPFDGCVYHLRYLQPDGKDADFIWACWGRQAFTTEQVQHAIDDLKATRFKRLRHNFLRFNVTPGDLDWFDDYSAVVNNARLAARVAREGGVGILFDTEQYAAPLFDYRKQRGASTKSWEQYAAQARKRGREVMQAFQEGFPGLKVLMTFGYGGPWQESNAGKRPLSECTCGLLSPFLDGMIEAAQGGAQLIDGWESAYSYFEEKKFRKARKMIHQDVLAMVADREKYQKVFSASFGLWMDYKWNEQGWDVEHPERNPSPPDKFEEIVRTALEYADEYVWIYSETPRWWSDKDGPIKLPPAYDTAIRRAASTAARQPASAPSQTACTSTRASDSPEDMFYTFGTDADKASAALFRSLGVTSVECYVTWETCEREAEGKWDWSRWDNQVRVLQDNGLKWVPFLILGPAYATPNWFRASKDHFPCRCLEHGTDSRIESLWNQNLPKWIDRFIGEFARR